MANGDMGTGIVLPLTPANANYHDVRPPVSSELLSDDIIGSVEDACKNLLLALGIDIYNDPNVKDTPHRMAKMYVEELCKGRFQPEPMVREFPNRKGYSSLYTVGPIAIKSLCAHHFLPFTGHCIIGILPFPTMPVLGLSKFARLAEWIFARPQIQEEATVQLADKLEEVCKPRGVAVMVRAEHQCMSLRGVKQPGSMMTTEEMRGEFLDPKSRAADDFYRLIQLSGFPRRISA